MAKKVSIGKDMQDSNLIQGDGNAIIQNEIDSQKISDGIERVSEAIYQTSDHEQETAETYRREISKPVLETMFVALFSAIFIGVFWGNLFPYNALTAPFFVIATMLLSYVLRLTHFGVRQTITRIIFLGTIFAALLLYVGGLSDLMNVNPFAGAAILGTIGAAVGLVLGVILSFWKPLGD